MLLQVSQFCQAVRSNINGMISRLEMETDRNMSDTEKIELKDSYQQVANMLDMATGLNPALAMASISTSSLVLEYHLPKASAWCDLVILGDGQDRPEVIIVELKNYRKETPTLAGEYEGLIYHNGLVRQHPAAQVRQYTKYCQYFHSTVVDEGARCSGLVYFTKDVDLSPYRQGPNASLCAEYPIYNATPSSATALAEYISDTIKKPNEAFARRFILGEYKQDRKILEQVAEALSSLKDSEDRNPFVLLDGQDLGFNLAMSTIEKICTQESQKEVIIISGPPGSGKSAVAANLWVECARRYRDNGNVLFVTTSSSQFEPWAQTFEESTRQKISGMVVKANAFNPGLTGTIVKERIAPYFLGLGSRYRKRGDVIRYDLYEEYLKYACEQGIIKDYNNTQFISIVDEAHALIDPSAPHFSTNKSGGWCYQVGPQAYHIIKQSKISIFLMDQEQSFRDNETTSIEAIRSYAARFGARVTEISLEGLQFRCAGSKDYVDWVDRMFSDSPLKNHDKWNELFEMKLVDSAAAVDEYLKSKDTKSIRVLSSYTVPWNSRASLQPMHGTCKDYDFVLKNPDGTLYRKFWNNPNAYHIFVKATRGSSMYENPLCEVGCPYSVRGYDYDYVGVLSLGDLLRRDGKWYLDIDRCQETATGSKRRLAKVEARSTSRRPSSLIPLDENHPQALEYATTIFQSYRILLTRGIKGVCLYVEDEQTRNYIASLLQS